MRGQEKGAKKRAQQEAVGGNTLGRGAFRKPGQQEMSGEFFLSVILKMSFPPRINSVLEDVRPARSFTLNPPGGALLPASWQHKASSWKESLSLSHSAAHTQGTQTLIRETAITRQFSIPTIIISI